jgi:CheY-like chemotaxis protein
LVEKQPSREVGPLLLLSPLTRPSSLHNGQGKSLTEDTILIVDDDEGIRDVLRLLFEHEGFRVVGQAADGLGAVALARSLRPSVAVIDQKMPRMTGGKAAEMIRTLSPDTRIVAFSAWLTEKPEWADAFLNKDRISEIAPLLGRLLRKPAPI